MHNQEFIEEMKQLLLQEKAELTKEVAAISDTTPGGETHPKHVEYGRDEESNAMEVGDQEAQEAVVRATETRLEEVEGALQRIAQDTYGITASGEEIPEQRLRANPAASTNV